MTKRRLLTSVAASTVLAGVLMLSGCGGSSNPDDNINSVNTSDGETTIKVGSGGLTSDVVIPVSGQDGTGTTVETAVIKMSKDSSELATECTTADPCTVTVVQSSICGNTVTTENVGKANELRSEVPDSSGKVVLFAGDITINEASGKLTSAGMEVTVKLPYCALAPTEIPGQTYVSDGKNKTGVASCDVMKVYVQTPDGDGEWVDGYLSQVSSGCTTNGEAYQSVTFAITGVPKDIFIFALRTPPSGYTGSTGGTGGTGY